MTTGGRIFVDVAQRGDTLAVRIADTGPGIPDAARARIFEPFYSTKAEGTGLGLPMARRIALAHGGDISVDSREGGGTVVTIHLPGGQGTGIGAKAATNGAVRRLMGRATAELTVRTARSTVCRTGCVYAIQCTPR